MATSPLSPRSSISSTSSSPAPIAAKRSVQALLDELSESDEEGNGHAQNVTSKSLRTTRIKAVEDESSDDDDVVMGAGRLAARLAGDVGVHEVSEGQRQSALGGLKIAEPSDAVLQAEAGEQNNFSSNIGQSDTFKPQRKLLLKRKRVAANDDQSQTSPAQSLGHPRRASLSPSPSRPDDPVNNISRSSPNTRSGAESADKSRFKALVEKARKERLAREQAEESKRAARQAQETESTQKPRRQRGSSPADDSEEDSNKSDTAPTNRLAKDARPTRKASRKALDEMSRETQRMNRNMQLAHQARTKKKFSMESFCASFGNGLPVVAETRDESTVGNLTASSSLSASDAENAMSHSTPPTSPLIESENEKGKPNAMTEGQPTISNTVDDDVLDVPDFLQIITDRRREESRSKEAAKLGDIRPLTVRTALALGVEQIRDSDSGSDVEVVFDKGLKRKYAAFENLPKRKAKETHSHLALRSLANIKLQKDKKSTMSNADMGPALFRAARKQAQEERQAKIEKLKAAGVNIQTAEQREQEEEQIEDLVERARQEDEEIRKREKELAKKDGTYVKDAFDEEDSDEEDEDFVDEDNEAEGNSGSDEDKDHGTEAEHDDDDGDDQATGSENELIDGAAQESEADQDSDTETPTRTAKPTNEESRITQTPILTRTSRNARIVVDDDEDDDDIALAVQSPTLPSARKTPQSILRSTRKVIPGLQHSDDLALGLTQAFAATMADSQTQEELSNQGQDSIDILRDLPSPHIDIVPRLTRLEPLDTITESIAGSQAQPLELNFGLSQSQRVPESPSALSQVGPSQAPFELTQDAGYSFSPFAGNRFAETPSRKPLSTEDTVILPLDSESPLLQRRSRLQRGHQTIEDEDEVDDQVRSAHKSAFQVMDKAAKRKQIQEFNKKKSEARQAVEEAAEESDDEYAGLGGGSDEDSGEEENEDDRQMIDEDTQVGKGDETKLAKLYADRERASDEQAVSKLLKDITTGALRRKRGVGDDLDLSDEEDAVARRREAKRREFAKMRKELLKDEAVGKIAEDRKKQAFLKSIEDQEDEDDSDNDFDQPETPLEVDSQSQQQAGVEAVTQSSATQNSATLRALKPIRDSQLNTFATDSRRSKAPSSRKPGTLAEIRESVSFLIEEPDSQAGLIDLDLSDSEDEPESYVNLDRHFAQAEADENAEDDEDEDLGGFVVDDADKDTVTSNLTFKKPELPSRTQDRAPFSDRRTHAVNVVDRLSLLKQQSSSAGSGGSSKMAFYTGKSAAGAAGSVPSLLKRATTNSSLGTMSGRDTISATGVVTSKNERSTGGQAKEFVRKGQNTSRNAINYQGRQNLKEEKMSARAGVVKKQQQKKGKNGFLSGLFRGDTWG